jgi:putative ABC transport system permease protein
VSRPARPWLRIGLRELAGGLSGFWIYLACLALGVWAIAGSGSVTEGFSRGLAQQSRMLLGGDAALTLSQRLAAPEERAWIAARAAGGVVGETASVDAMGRAGDVIRQVDLRGIDDRFPLLGEVGLDAAAPPLADVLARRAGVWGMAASRSLLEDFGLAVGDRLDLGGWSVEIRAVLEREPDRLGEHGAFQPRGFVHIDALKEQDLLAAGRLFRVSYRLLLADGDVAGFLAAAEAQWGDAGMRVAGPEDAIDGLRELLSLLNSFMAVIGIAALVAGGVGVAQATSSFLDTRIESIAALKALGADAGTIRAAYALQLGALAALGSAIGAALGAATPFILEALAGDRIPLPNVLGVFPVPLLRALALGLLAATLFAAPALGRARATPPAALFRQLGEHGAGRAPLPELLAAAAAAAGLVAVAMLGSPRPLVTLGLLAGAAVAALVLAGAARAVKLAGRAASRRARGYARLALASLGGPGSLAPTVAPALGLGLALLTLVSTVQTNLLRQIAETAPQNAPSLVFRQIPHEEVAAFDALLREQGIAVDDPQSYRRGPLILGRVVRLNGAEIVEADVDPDERWVIDGEIGMTFLAEKPPEADIRAGRWWPADHAGPLLVSVEQGAARGLGLDVGDSIGFRIFGRDLEAGVASIRAVDWGGFGQNMAFILSPGVLEAARPFHLAIARAEPEIEKAAIAAVAQRFPEVLAFEVRRALETAADLFEQVAFVVSFLAGVVTVAGALVLFGAFAAAARSRRRESALLKTFGASRPAILALYAGEFALAGAAAAGIGAALGVAAAWPVVVNVFEAEWSLDWRPLATVAGIAVAAAAAGGAAVGWATLSRSPARVLRSA